MCDTPGEARAMDAAVGAMHGTSGSADWAAPACVTEFDTNARHTFSSVKAHEWCDAPDVLRAKVAALAGLVRRSTRMVAYTGAGISTAAGIDDYATRAKRESVTAARRPALRDWRDARPTRTHYVMAALHRAGHLTRWVQQNHDSLPQKAGYPQHALNEIHGSLHDPSNPVVPYEGTLRHDLCRRMEQWAAESDLCLAMGTSLSGFTADGVALRSAERHAAGDGAGLVLINLQQTPYDAMCSLRIFAKVDDVMELLAAELGIAGDVAPMGHVHVPRPVPGSELAGDVFRVPFAADGRPLPPEGGFPSMWDLRAGQRVRLTGGPYDGDEGTITGKNADGHYRIVFRDSVHPVFNVKRKDFVLWLGGWFVAEATRGRSTAPGGPLPFVNVAAREPPPAAAARPRARGGGTSPRYERVQAAGRAEERRRRPPPPPPPPPPAGPCPPPPPPPPARRA